MKSALSTLAVGALALTLFAYAPAPNHTKVEESTVLICNSKNAYAYHKYKCRGLARCKASISKITLSEAKNAGYKPCGNCY